jgi:hypothetical protein
MKKDFSPVSYRFFQFVDEFFHYVGIGSRGEMWARRFCLWANRETKDEDKMETCCIDVDDLIGNLSNKTCPDCGSSLWVNKRGDEWCSECSYSNDESITKQAEEMFGVKSAKKSR